MSITDSLSKIDAWVLPLGALGSQLWNLVVVWWPTLSTHWVISRRIGVLRTLPARIFAAGGKSLLSPQLDDRSASF